MIWAGLKFCSIKVQSLFDFATTFEVVYMEANWFPLKFRQKIQVFMQFLFLF